MMLDDASPEMLQRVGERLRSAHRFHARAMLIVPLLGLIAASVDAWFHGISRTSLALFLVFYVLSGLGITVGFHRLFAHRAFGCPPWLAEGLAILGSTAGQGPLFYWVANHRRHHQYSDEAGDPHSPLVRGAERLDGWRGFWHAHLGWTFEHELTNTLKYTPDLLKSPGLRRVNQHYVWWLLLGLLLPTLLGGLLSGSLYGAWTGLLWGGLVRLFWSYHLTLAINSLAHLWGGQSYETHDSSRNNVWLALPTLGESWHNNHHAAPSSAFFSAAWWQVDLGGLVIRALRMAGLTVDVREMSSAILNKKRKVKGSATAPHSQA